MSEVVGYQLVETANPSKIIESWGGVYGQSPSLPASINLPNGNQVAAPDVRKDYEGWTLLPWNMDAPVTALLDGTAFISKLTDAEYVAIVSAAQSNATIGRWWSNMIMTNHVDVAGQTSQAAKAALVSANALTSQRAAALFAGA